MTGKEIALLWFRKPYEQPCAEELALQIDAAIQSERERCAQVVWEYKGCCVSDESARHLMEHVRRTP